MWEDWDLGASLRYKKLFLKTQGKSQVFILIFFFRKQIFLTNLVFCDTVPIDCTSYNFKVICLYIEWWTVSIF